MKNVEIVRTYTDAFRIHRVEHWTRVYRYYTDPSNFEAVEARDMPDDCKLLRWIAKGTGSWFQPRGTIVDGKIIVRAHPIELVTLANSEHCHYVHDGAGLPVEFES